MKLQQKQRALCGATVCMKWYVILLSSNTHHNYSTRSLREILTRDDDYDGERNTHTYENDWQHEMCT